MTKRIAFYLSFALIVWACDGPFEKSVSGAITIESSQFGSDYFFAGLPTMFVAKSSVSYRGIPYPNIDKWTFGDNDASVNVAPYHVFDFPGRYRVSVSTDKGEGYADTLILIEPKPSLIGSKHRPERGKFLLTSPVSGYNIIMATINSTGATEWQMLTVTSKFDSLRSRRLPIPTHSDVHLTFLNRDFHTVLVSDGIWEYNEWGNVVRSVTTRVGASPISGIEIDDGYIMGGFNFDASLVITRFDRDFQVIAQGRLETVRPGYFLPNFSFETDEIIRLHYREDTGMDNAKWSFVKMSLNGETLFESSYEADLAVSESFKLGTGYLLYGVRSYNGASDAAVVFTKVDDTGAVEWSLKSPRDSWSPYDFKARIFELDGFIYIFFDNQRGIKVSMDGNVVWSKRFSINTDRCIDVILNETGNFVILGAHQFDYLKMEYTTDVINTDISLTEVTIDGTIVDKH
ncbi:MAG: hypothetical protein KDC99_16545 [Cyclobacteriaceae bacterium]|nr:hypothetical protein [Cyclobacteriaceae bacterium]